jgi:hypothetical protein
MTCVCGHAIEDHDHEAECVAATGAVVCGCVMYEPEHEEDEEHGYR